MDGPAALEDALQILYATDGCAIGFSLMLLTGQEEPGRGAYVVSYNWPGRLAACLGGESPNDVALALADARPLVAFYLLGGPPGGSAAARPRAWPVFVCTFNSAQGARALADALLLGKALPARVLLEHLAEDVTFALHADMITALLVATEQLAPRTGRTADDARYVEGQTTVRSALRARPAGRRGLASLYIHHEHKTVAAYRRLYANSGATPFWFLSKFGPGEKTLVLATRFYVFQAERAGDAATYDLQAVRDCLATYAVAAPPNPSGLAFPDLVSFAALAAFCCRSGYARGAVAAGAPAYVAARIEADLAEVRCLREYIDHDRRSLKVADPEFVAYVYLAYFEGFNRRQITEHLRAVTATEPPDGGEALAPRLAGVSRLRERAVDAFFRHVRAQFNVQSYIEQNVAVAVVRLPPATAEAYARARTYARLLAATANGPGRTICDGAAALRAALDHLEGQAARFGWVLHAPGAPSASAVPGPGLDAALALGAPDGGASPDATPACCGVSKRLLELAAAAARDGAHPLDGLFGARGTAAPTPVYRVELPRGHQAFAVADGDDWAAVTSVAALDPDEVAVEVAAAAAAAAESGRDALVERDARLTALLTERAACAAGRSDRRSLGPAAPRDQYYVNRNELFNARLAVTNIVLDVDFRLKRPLPRGDLHGAMRSFRRGALAALAALFPEIAADAWPAHPCFFYKSACPSAAASNLGDGDASPSWAAPDRDAGWDEYESALAREGEAQYSCEDVSDPAGARPEETGGAEGAGSAAALTTACGCDDKMGFRVAVPVPAPYIIAGGPTLKGIARLVQHAVMLERPFAEAMSRYLRDFAFVDAAVYTHGHSLRLPFFGKPDAASNVGRWLLPFYVVPERCDDVAAFVAAHRDPHHFHFHAAPPAGAPPRTHVLRSVGGEYVSFFERKAAVNRAAFHGVRVSLRRALAAVGVDGGDRGAVEEFIADVIEAELAPYMAEHYPQAAREYQGAGARLVAAKADWLLAQLVPARARAGTAQGFGCLRAAHGRAAQNKARSLVSLSVDSHDRLCASLIQQCFATKCGSNRLGTVFTVDLSGRAARYAARGADC
ncbi:DNA replication protein [bovine alphaherpesvirus 1]|uniref:Component of DNA helicase/primase complex n=1 Tax=Bovine herpesvirus 1 TaxID=10320 RepID=K4P1G4_BHV1|nr:component of DNA helicase/primase complex [Bovine herpesvirus type 1.1]ALR87773.1 helicase-primase primase subunit [Bovine alphaherpesvirus 1]AFV53366.1 component of DNA helicase/primase complex [Bovine herpesvirus type 1.1]AWK60616.1 DNA replication protein [Bovine alphaherpesvirus 1]QBH74878.1 DNA replication protein [Bovine alphaherpesvirus 1]QBH74950.1 DNA replication protein [Bovine alphaherpesvirus 1]